MFGIPLGTTRSVLLVESKDKDGNLVVVAHSLRLLSTSYSIDRNLFHGDRARVDIEAVHMGGSVWEGPMPDPEQTEIEPAQLAIASNESEIIVDEEGFEEWQRED